MTGRDIPAYAGTTRAGAADAPRRYGTSAPTACTASGADAVPRPGPDLRLVAPALGAWLSALCALHLSASQGIALSAIGAGAALVVWRVSRRRIHRDEAKHRVATAVVLGVLLGVVTGAASTAARVHTRDAEPLAQLARERTTVRADLRITSDPRPTRGSAYRGWVVDARLVRLRSAALSAEWGGSARLDARVLVVGRHPTWRRVLPGQPVSVTGRLAPPRGGDLQSALLSVSDTPHLRGAPPVAQRAADVLRDGLQLAVAPLPDAPGGLLPGLAIGDVSRMDPAVEEDFRATGMTHLTAVSGANVAIVIGFVLLLAAWCRAGPRTSAALAALALVGFVILVRPSPSVLRAAVMGGLALVALASSRPRAAVPGLAAAVYLLVVVDPQLAAHPGFALSVLATAGLLLLAPRWRDALRRRGVPSGVAEALAVPVAAQAACAPVIAALTGTVSLSSIPANLVAAPAVAPATILGAAAAVVSPLWTDAAGLLAWLGSWPAAWLVFVARHGAELPNSTAPWFGGVWGGLLLATVLAVLLVLTRHRQVRRVLAVSTAAVVVGVASVQLVTSGWPPPDWTLVACDVGQGDALALRTGPGQAIVVDAGPEPSDVDRCLRRLGVVTVPLLVVSHFHADHVGGVTGAVRGRTIGAFVTPTFADPGSGVDAVARSARDNGAPTVAVGAGWTYRIGHLQLDVLGPDETETGTRSDSNNNSLVLRVTTRDVTVLLPGDAEIERQQALLSTGEEVHATILKVPHHGSRYQDVEFLRAVDPALAIVSVGADNSYGHPNASLLRQLEDDGARVVRTDHSGDVAVSRTATGLSVTSRGRPPGRSS